MSSNRRISGVVIGGVLLSGLVLVPAAPALAADCSAGGATSLAGLNADLAGGGTSYLGGDIGVPTPETTSVEVVPGQPATIDLCGRTLSIQIVFGGNAAVHVPAGASLTIVDSVGDGLLRAVGSDDMVDGAGIGATGAEDAGDITIDSGTIEATGGGVAAGIGGGHSLAAGGSAGTITINGGTVTAIGPNYGAGIGTGTGGIGGSITINGGSVTATGLGWSGAGIGGGAGGGIDSIAINGGTVVARHAPLSPSAGNLGHGAAGVPGPAPAAIRGLLLPGSSLPATANGPVGATGAAPLVLTAGTSLIEVTADADEFRFIEIPLIRAVPSALTADIGDTITVEGFLVDSLGVDHLDVTGSMTLTSSVPEDTITGSSVTFNHASPHTITVGYGGLTTTFVVEVSAVLPPTGADGAQIGLLVGGGLALVILGGGLLLLRRRTTG